MIIMSTGMYPKYNAIAKGKTWEWYSGGTTEDNCALVFFTIFLYISYNTDILQEVDIKQKLDTNAGKTSWFKNVVWYLPHPMSKKNHHFLDSLLKITTSIRWSMIPSHNIQQKAARKK